jgi:hypothetical protein
MTIWAGHRTGVARLCAAVPGRARLGAARNGKETGGRSPLRFDSAAPAHSYEARPGTAGMGEAGRGTAGHGGARIGWDWRGMELGDWQPLGFEAPAPARGQDRPGVARIGWGGQGMERVTSRVWGATPRRSRTTGQGVAWCGAARHGVAAQGADGFGGARLVKAWPGVARRCAARHGTGDWQASGFEPSTSTQRGWAGHGSAGSGMARLGAAQALQGQERHGKGVGRLAEIEVRLLDAHARPGLARQGLARQGRDLHSPQRTDHV